MRKTYCLLLLMTLLVNFSEAQTTRPRTIITTDGEIDDQDSFMRLLLYSNELDIIGLVYSSSMWHYKGDDKGTWFTSEMDMTKKLYSAKQNLRWPGTTWMQELIDKYGTVHSNLLLHDKRFPSANALKQLVKVGNIDFEGEMEKVTEGSEFIKDILLDESKGPIYIQLWGGTNTVARTLKSIEEQYKGKPEWDAIYKKVSKKAIIYTVLDQDGTYMKYVGPNWPNIKVIYNSKQFWCLAYPWKRVIPEPLQVTLKGKWMAEHIKFNHGKLLEQYFLWGDGQKLAGDSEHTHGSMGELQKNNQEQYDFISEGDSPAFFYLLDVGLGGLENASYGGWGGRMVQSNKNPFLWDDRLNVTDYNPYTKKEDAAYPQTRWIEAIQHDFGSRADWCVKNYKQANHAPIVRLNHAPDLKGKPGSAILLNGVAKDPDGNKVSYKWWHYAEAGTYAGKVEIVNPSKAAANITVPKDARAGDTIHVILEVTDSGLPTISRYQRVIIEVL